MSTEEQEKMTVWARWGVTVLIVVVVNFVSVSYYAGSTTSTVERNAMRLDSLESERVTKEQFNELKVDVKEIKADIKELGRRK